MTTANESELKGKRRTRLVLGGVAGVLLACAVSTGFGALMISGSPAVSSLWSDFLTGSGIGKLIDLSSDAELAELAEALDEKWGPDPTIPSAGMGLETYYSSDDPEAEIWLGIEISYTGACTSTSDDPCEALVDELARIVFDNYTRVDELTGIRISITNYADFGIVEFSDTLIDKALTIKEWRRELSIDDEEGGPAPARSDEGIAS